MFQTLYTTSIAVYQALLHVVAPLHRKARLWVAGRQQWAAHLTHAFAGNTQPVAWFHAASLGEFEQGRPVIEAFRAQYPDYRILLTFFSPSGYEVRKHYAGADYVCYLPADLPANARQFLDVVQPRIAFFIKYEFWANYLRELRARNVVTISFSAIFRPGQLFFKANAAGQFYRHILHQFNHILVQNDESARLLRSAGLTAVTVAGDTRFDRVAAVAQDRKDVPIARDFVAEGVPVLVVGSAWPADMDVLIPFLNAFEEPLKVIIAPHEIHEAEIRRWQSQLQKPSTTFSEAQKDQSRNHAITQYLFIDNIGLLSSLYQYGQFAYVGGAFGRGLHNILEAATFGLPLLFGPNYAKFQEAVDLTAEGGAFPLRSPEALSTTFRRLYASSEERERAAAVCRHYVARNIGATAQVMHVVKSLIVNA